MEKNHYMAKGDRSIKYMLMASLPKWFISKLIVYGSHKVNKFTKVEERLTGEPDAMKVARPVRGGGVGKAA